MTTSEPAVASGRVGVDHCPVRSQPVDHATHSWMRIEAADAVTQGVRDMISNVRPSPGD
jgi:hypothetical protein